MNYYVQLFVFTAHVHNGKNKVISLPLYLICFAFRTNNNISLCIRNWYTIFLPRVNCLVSGTVHDILNPISRLPFFDFGSTIVLQTGLNFSVSNHFQRSGERNSWCPFIFLKNDRTLVICIFNSYFSTSRFIKLQVSLTRVCHGDLHSVSPHHSLLCSVRMVKISGYVKMIGAHLSTQTL